MFHRITTALSAATLGLAMQGAMAGDLPITASAGRTTTIDLGLSSDFNGRVEITLRPEFGVLTVNPDNTLSLVISDPTIRGEMSYAVRVYQDDNSSVFMPGIVEVVAGSQRDGWGKGSFYQLEVDEAGDLVIEHGDNHREIHVTRSDDAWSYARIAEARGAYVSRINKKWLANDTEYGTVEKPLDIQTGMELWYELTNGRNAGRTSHHLLFEAGYEYEGTNRLVTRNGSGESALHPMYIGSYGEGPDPVILDQVQIFQNVSTNVVIADLDLRGGVMALEGENIMFSDLKLSGNGFNVQNLDKATIRNTEVSYVARTKPADDSAFWEAHRDRVQGAFISKTKGLLIENALIHHNGWTDGYRYDRSTEAGQPISMFSHNLYLQSNNRDVTVRDSVISQGASFGMQIRSGGVVEDVAFIDNNIAVATVGGDYQDAGPIGQYTLFLDDVITSGGWRTVDALQGAVGGALRNEAHGTALIGTIVAHLANPADAAEVALKRTDWTSDDDSMGSFFSNKIVYNWAGSSEPNLHRNDKNVPDIDHAKLDLVTIQNFAAQYLGKDEATISGLIEALMNNGHDGAASAIVEWFQAGFGMNKADRNVPTILRFVPDERADGLRWDNRLNWTTLDKPGSVAGDSVDLAGNRVQFAGTVRIEDLHMGDGGRLLVSQGKLTVEGALDARLMGGAFEVSNAGQAWIESYSGTTHLGIDLTDGRFANTGLFDGNTVLVASGGQALLATDGARWTIGTNGSLRIEGSRPKVGFDGHAGASGVLDLDGGTVSFITDSEGVAGIGEFRSGAFGEAASAIESGIDLSGGILSLDLTEALMSNRMMFTTVLMTADEVVGSLAEFRRLGSPDNRNVFLTVDYIADTVSVTVTAAGSGTGRWETKTIGTADDNAGSSVLNTLLDPA